MACSPNTEPGADTLAIFSPSLMTSTAPLLRKNSRPVFEPAARTTWPAGCFNTGKPASLLSKASASGISEGMLGSFPWDLNKLFDVEIARSSWTQVQLRQTRVAVRILAVNQSQEAT